MELKGKIISVINQKGSATLSELCEDLPELRGQCEWTLISPKLGECVLWSGLSKEACVALSEVLRGNETDCTAGPQSQIAYLMGGLCLGYPVHSMKRFVKRPHWVPLVFLAKGPPAG